MKIDIEWIAESEISTHTHKSICKAKRNISCVDLILCTKWTWYVFYMENKCLIFTLFYGSELVLIVLFSPIQIYRCQNVMIKNLYKTNKNNQEHANLDRIYSLWLFVFFQFIMQKFHGNYKISDLPRLLNAHTKQHSVISL